MPIKMSSSLRVLTAIFAALLLGSSLVGCAGWDTPAAKPTTGRNPLVAEVPTQEETVRGEDDPPVVTLELGSALQEHKLSGGDDLPGKIVIPTTNLNAVPITAALQGVLTGTDISLSWNTGDLGNRLVTVVNLSGPLPKVVEKICSAAKVFCIYRNGTIELQEQDTFVVSIPPALKVAGSGGTNSMVDAISTLVGSKVQVDGDGGNIIYTASVDTQQVVRQYLQQLRNGRPLVVLQIYIWEVTLDKRNAEGINWKQLNAKFGPALGKVALAGTSGFTSLANTVGNVGIGAVTTGQIKSDALLSFLATQGRVQNISSPQVTFVSGSSASLKVGGTQRYISQVGSGTTASGSTASTTANTVSTDNIDTGLSIEVDGTYENGVVFANLKVALKSVVSLNPTTTGGQTINLPETADEKIETLIRVRPGDNLVMAGLVSSKDTNKSEGLPLFGSRIPMFGDDQLENRELVIMVKPSVVMFSDKMAVAEDKKKSEGTLPDAIVIDKDGAQMMKIPTVSASAMQPQPVKPEVMVTAPPSPLALPTPITNENGAVVDRNLMQRGFSHAFDDLLSSTPKPNEAMR